MDTFVRICTHTVRYVCMTFVAVVNLLDDIIIRGSRFVFTKTIECLESKNNEVSSTDEIRAYLDTRLQCITDAMCELENRVMERHRHAVNCAMYRAVCVCDEISAMVVSTLGCMYYDNILIYDRKEQCVNYTVTDDTFDLNNGYRVVRDVSIVLMFETPVLFKRIEFIGLRIDTPKHKGDINLIYDSSNTSEQYKTTITNKKHTICNIAF